MNLHNNFQEVFVNLPFRETMNLCRIDKRAKKMCEMPHFWKEKAELLLGTSKGISNAREYKAFEDKYVLPFTDPEFVFRVIEDFDPDEVKYVVNWGQRHYPNKNIPTEVVESFARDGQNGIYNFINSGYLDLPMAKSFINNYHLDNQVVYSVYFHLFGMDIDPKKRRDLIDFLLTVPEFQRTIPCYSWEFREILTNAIVQDDLWNLKYMLDDVGILEKGCDREPYLYAMEKAERINYQRAMMIARLNRLPFNKTVRFEYNNTYRYVKSMA